MTPMPHPTRPRRRPRPRPTALQVLGLTREIDRLQHDLLLCQRFSREQAEHLRTIQAKRAEPVAYLESAKRLVPLMYWGDQDLLRLLHTLEVHAGGSYASADQTSDRLTYKTIGFPLPLYHHVVRMAEDRGLITRGTPTPADAENDWHGLGSVTTGTRSVVSVPKNPNEDEHL